MTTKVQANQRKQELSSHAITEEEISWLKSVKFHAQSTSQESRNSLRELKRITPISENPFIQAVSEAMNEAAKLQFIELKDLHKSAANALDSAHITSPKVVRARSSSPPFFK